jgi:hypothetical protein
MAASEWELFAISAHCPWPLQPLARALQRLRWLRLVSQGNSHTGELMMQDRQLEWVRKFSSLSQLGKVEFLTKLIHEETIRVRITRVIDSDTTGETPNSNELIHQFCNYIFQILEISRYLTDADIIEYVYDYFEIRGEYALTEIEALLDTHSKAQIRSN